MIRERVAVALTCRCSVIIVTLAIVIVAILIGTSVFALTFVCPLAVRPAGTRLRGRRPKDLGEKVQQASRQASMLAAVVGGKDHGGAGRSKQLSLMVLREETGTRGGSFILLRCTYHWACSEPS